MELHKIVYNRGKKTCHTEKEFRSVEDFLKLMELEGEDLSELMNVRLEDDQQVFE